MTKSAFITGICGQDGYYLSQQLLREGYRVYGTDIPPAIEFEKTRGDFNSVELMPVNLEDRDTVDDLLGRFQFNEVYNLAAVSFIPASWDEPHKNLDINARIPLNLLEAIRCHSPQTRIFQACSSELFGDCSETPQNENTPFHPRSPYSVNKIYSYHMMELYREYREVFAVNGILYNHESVRRPAKFVTRKITRGAASIKLGLQQKLELGDLNAKRDWSFAGDIVRAFRLTLAHDRPGNYVIGSGRLHSVAEFCDAAFSRLDLDYRDFVEVNPAFVRKEKSILQANPAKIQKELGWEPEVTFEELVGQMVDHDLQELTG